MLFICGVSTCCSVLARPHLKTSNADFLSGFTLNKAIYGKKNNIFSFTLTERGNKAKIVDHFSKTIEVLVENGADPGIDNFAGSSVNDLLTEFNIAELSMLIANKLTSVRYFDGQLPNGIKGSDFMLFKDDQGKVDLRKMKEKKMKKPVPLMPKVIKPPPPTKTKTTPIIIENIEYKPPVKVDNSLNTPSVSNSIPKPVNVGPANVENDQAKQELIQNKTPIVKNFRLNKPLLITSDVTNNKRKLDIVVDTSKSKKPNNND